jgi:hypothetical protein
VVFNLDTGAQCNVLTKRVVDILGRTRLVTYDGGRIDLVGGT